MTMEPKVSILIPTYNSARYLSDCIDSVLGQTYRNFEVVVLDDGSTDDTSKVISSFIDQRLKYVKFPHNKGIVSVLNFGLNLSKAEYILRIDADDIMAPTRISEQLAFMENNPEIGAVGSYFFVFTDNNLAGTKKAVRLPVSPSAVDFRIAFQADPVIGHPFALIRSVAIKGVNGYDSKYNRKGMEDIDLWLRIRSSGWKIANLPQKLTFYRLHHNQESSKNVAEVEKNYIDAFREFVFNLTEKEISTNVAYIVKKSSSKVQIHSYNISDLLEALRIQIKIYGMLSGNSQSALRIFLRSALGSVQTILYFIKHYLIFFESH